MLVSKPLSLASVSELGWGSISYIHYAFLFCLPKDCRPEDFIRNLVVFFLPFFFPSREDCKFTPQVFLDNSGYLHPSCRQEGPPPLLSSFFLLLRLSKLLLRLTEVAPDICPLPPSVSPFPSVASATPAPPCSQEGWRIVTFPDLSSGMFLFFLSAAVFSCP